MSSLRLLEQLIDELCSSLVQALAFKKLCVAKNRSQWIVQLVRHACNQLSHCRHLFALQQLFLGLAQVFVSATSFFIEANFLDGRSQLAANRYQQVFIVAAVDSALAAADSHHAYRHVLAPQQHPYPGTEAVGTDEVGDRRRQVRKVFHGDDFSAGASHQITEPTMELNFSQAGAIGDALSPTGATTKRGLIRIAQVNRSGLRAEQ